MAQEIRVDAGPYRRISLVSQPAPNASGRKLRVNFEFERKRQSWWDENGDGRVSLREDRFLSYESGRAKKRPVDLAFLHTHGPALEHYVETVYQSLWQMDDYFQTLPSQDGYFQMKRECCPFEDRTLSYTRLDCTPYPIIDVVLQDSALPYQSKEGWMRFFTAKRDVERDSWEFSLNSSLCSIRMMGGCTFDEGVNIRLEPDSPDFQVVQGALHYFEEQFATLDPMLAQGTSKPASCPQLADTKKTQ